MLLLVSLVGGAFAWTDFTQSRTNKFHGTFEADVTLHDEFDGVNKDVFVENTGANPIYVRVRLDEYMKVGELVLDPMANVHDKTTWNPHTYAADVENCEHAQDGQFHDYYKWTISGAQRNYNPGTPGMVYSVLGVDGIVDTSGTQLTAAAQAPILLSDVTNALAAATPTTDQQTLLNALEAGCWILADNQTAVFNTLPAGLYYEVFETPQSGYTTSSAGTTGNIEEGRTQQAVFVNTTGEGALDAHSATIEVEKRVDGEVSQGDEAHEFRFIFYLNNEAPLHFTLEAGKSLSFMVTTGDTYRIVEEDPFAEGYLLAESYNATGTVTLDETSVLFVNRYEGTVWKTIEGEKTWDMTADPTAELPTSIEVQLFANG